MGVLDRAKQGDAQAIATLINRSLALKGVTALVRSRANRLDIVLQGETVPVQSEFLPLIARGIQNLGIYSPVHLYARRLGEDTAAWKQILTAKTAPQSNPAKPKSSALAVSINMSQLYQKKLSLKEFQDVVVRFSDRQGRVKCLTSLKELVQVISRPSFAYGAIAKDNNLRNLLDNLAEFGTIDRSGRQLLTQAEILSPGQSWRKVNIQISNQLTFLPGDESPAINVNVSEDYVTPQAEAFAPVASLLDEFSAAVEGDYLELPQESMPSVSAAPEIKRPETPKAEEWLDEFGAAAEKDIEAQKPLEIYTQSTKWLDASKPEKPNLAIAQEYLKSPQPPVVPYSSTSGSFLDEFTAAINANDTDANGKEINNFEQKPDLYTDFEALTTPEPKLELFGLEAQSEPNSSLELFGELETLIKDRPLDSLELLPPKPPVPSTAENESAFDLFENLFDDLPETSETPKKALTETLSEIPNETELTTEGEELIASSDLKSDSQLDSQPDPSELGSIFDEFTEELTPSPNQLPYSMNDLLAELQSSSFRQPKPPKTSSN
jgi:hypothetical protein